MTIRTGIQSGNFNPQSSHKFIDILESEKDKRHEITLSLYFDTDQNQFFTVEDSDHESGPRISVNHEIEEISEVDLIARLNEAPERKSKAAEVSGRTFD